MVMVWPVTAGIDAVSKVAFGVFAIQEVRMASSCGSLVWLVVEVVIAVCVCVCFAMK